MVRWKKCIAFGMALLWIVTAHWSSSAKNGNQERYVQSPLHIQSQSETVVGFTPSQIRNAYGFAQIANAGANQTIGIVIPFDNDRIEDDLNTFSGTFDLPACTTDNGCFRKIFSTDKNPGTKAIWTLETALDVEWAHAIAPDARILLVEAPSDRLEDLINAVDVAVRNGANVVSMSWGAAEFETETENDTHFLKSGITFVAGAGNAGTGGFYPAASPNVVSVGATRLNLNASGGYAGESAWSGSSGGLSQYEPEPSFQLLFEIPNNTAQKRGIPDVAYSGDPTAGFAVYSSHPVLGTKNWFQLGGTSAATPQWAALFAIVNSIRRDGRKSPLSGNPGVLYEVARPSNYHDITSGSNGDCGPPVCTAAVGYDYVTGLGSPVANRLIPALVNK